MLIGTLVLVSRHLRLEGRQGYVEAACADRRNHRSYLVRFPTLSGELHWVPGAGLRQLKLPRAGGQGRRR